MAALLHRAVDALAMWIEDRRDRTPAGFRGADPAPLDCFGPFAPLAGAPPADLAAAFAEAPLGRRYVRLAARAGAPFPDGLALARLLAPLRPDLRPAPAGAVFVALGREDRIALPAGALALARAWGVVPRVYPRGHLTLLFGCRALRRDLGRFLAAAAGP